MANLQKAVMVGCGFVGSASVFALMQSGLFSEIALIDANQEKAAQLYLEPLDSTEGTHERTDASARQRDTCHHQIELDKRQCTFRHLTQPQAQDVIQFDEKRKENQIEK